MFKGVVLDFSLSSVKLCSMSNKVGPGDSMTNLGSRNKAASRKLSSTLPGGGDSPAHNGLLSMPNLAEVLGRPACTIHPPYLL